MRNRVVWNSWTSSNVSSRGRETDSGCGQRKTFVLTEALRLLGVLAKGPFQTERYKVLVIEDRVGFLLFVQPMKGLLVLRVHTVNGKGCAAARDFSRRERIDGIDRVTYISVGFFV